LTDELDLLGIWEEINQKPLTITESQIVEDMYWKVETKEIRMNIKQGKNTFFLDIILDSGDGSFDMFYDKSYKYEDKSIFKFD
jgi:hypothetical protein